MWVADYLRLAGASFVGYADCRGPLKRDIPAQHDALDDATRRSCKFSVDRWSSRSEDRQSAPADLNVVDLTPLPETERLAQCAELGASELRQPFDLSIGPLMRTTLVMLGSRHHMLLVSWHHIICDAWSVAVFVRELATLYADHINGRPSQLPATAGTYWESVISQRQLAERDDPKGLAYWKERLGRHEPLALPADRPAPVLSFDVVSSPLRVEQDLSDALRRSRTAAVHAVQAVAGSKRFVSLLPDSRITVEHRRPVRARRVLRGCFAYHLFGRPT